MYTHIGTGYRSFMVVTAGVYRRRRNRLVRQLLYAFDCVSLKAVILRGFFFMILVTLISRSPCCSSSESGSQARQRYKSWYVTYIFDLVSLKAVILSTWFLSSGYSFVSNAIPLIFELTLESLCNHDKSGPSVFSAYALVLLV